MYYSGDFGLGEDGRSIASIGCCEIQEVSKAIMASKIPQKPISEIGKAICDADMAHLASPQYDHWADKLEAEWVATDDDIQCLW